MSPDERFRAGSAPELPEEADALVEPTPGDDAAGWSWPEPWSAGEEEGGPPTVASPHRRWWWLLTATAVPWVVLGLLGVRGALPARTPGDPGAAPRAPATGAGPSEAPPGPEPEVGARGAEEESVRPDAARDDEAAGVAAVVARAWLNGLGPGIPVAGIEPVTDAYVAQLHVTRVERAGSDAVVVTMLAVLLEKSSGHLTTASVGRLAVPVRVAGTGPAPAGPPWWLAPPSLEPHPPDTRRVRAPELQVDAGAALAAAGYRSVRVRGLRRAGRGLYVVTARAIAPGRPRTARHVVWLLDHGGRLIVAGTGPPAGSRVP